MTRRTERRTHLFRPDAKMKVLFLYMRAVRAETCGILVHVAVLMATHEHLVITDPRGELPLFLHRFHRLVALGTKVLRKWEGAVWDRQPTSAVALLTGRAAIEKRAYAIVNPVKAGLVARSGDWPGVTTCVDELGQAVWMIPKPDWFLDQENPMWPERAVLRLTWPPGLVEEYGAERLRELVAATVARGTNTPAVINGRQYRGHALDQIQGRGLTPSVVEDTIAQGAQSAGRGGAGLDPIR